MIRKPQPTKEEIAEREAIKDYNRKYAGFKRSLITLCKEDGLRSMELRFEFLKSHPNTQLPKPFFTHEQHVKCYEEAITEYRDALIEKQKSSRKI